MTDKQTKQVFKVTFTNGGSVLTEDWGILFALTRQVEKGREVAKIERCPRHGFKDWNESLAKPCVRSWGNKDFA